MNSVIVFLSQMVNFPTRIADSHSHSSVLLGLFFSSEANICSTTAFPPLGKSDHIVVLVSIDTPSNSRWGSMFHRIAYYCSCADWYGLHDQLRDVLWEDIFKFFASAAIIFCVRHVGTDVYVPHLKHQVKPVSSPWFPAVFATSIEITFFVCTNRVNFLNLN